MSVYVYIRTQVNDYALTSTVLLSVQWPGERSQHHCCQVLSFKKMRDAAKPILTLVNVCTYVVTLSTHLTD